MRQGVERTGGCLCGAVRYRVGGPMRPFVACYCRQCQRTSGNFVVATAVRNRDLEIEGVDGVTWYPSSPHAECGFCATCGSNLFWRRIDADRTGIMAGTFDDGADLTLAFEIFTANKGAFHPDYTGIELRGGDARDDKTYPDIDV